MHFIYGLNQLLFVLSTTENEFYCSTMCILKKVAYLNTTYDNSKTRERIIVGILINYTIRQVTKMAGRCVLSYPLRYFHKVNVLLTIYIDNIPMI